MKEKFFAAAMLGLVLTMGLTMSLVAWQAGDLPTGFDSLPDWAGRTVKRSLSQQEWIVSLAPDLLLRGGAKEQDGIFITKNALLENIKQTDPAIAAKNLAGVQAFLSKHNLPATVALLPTACAIKQQEIPYNAPLLNQKNLIADAYTALSGEASSVDAYAALFAAKDQYTYYRTASNLTGLGGYYVYQALSTKMGFTPRSIEQFAVEILPHDWYGDLYTRSRYQSARPDLLTLYRFHRYKRYYQVKQTVGGNTKQYYTLFPTHLSALDRPQDVVLGGLGEQLDILVSSPFEESLLIFADQTALSYLPFLVVHFGRITVVNTEQASLSQLAALSTEEYDRVLFAYSVESWIRRPGAAMVAMVP